MQDRRRPPGRMVLVGEDGDAGRGEGFGEARSARGQVEISEWRPATLIAAVRIRHFLERVSGVFRDQIVSSRGWTPVRGGK